LLQLVNTTLDVDNDSKTVVIVM